MPYLNDMNFIEQMIQQANLTQPAGFDIRLPKGGAYASFPPQYEVTTPQYTYPAPLTMVRQAYKTNEFAYSIMQTRAQAKSAAMACVFDNEGEHPEIDPKHVMTKFLRRPNQFMSWRKFMQIKQIFQDIAGFAAFEIETNILGEPLRLWPMLPHFCSFLRGNPYNDDMTINKSARIRAIRYMPYGLPWKDIPIENILFFSNGEGYDPEYNDIRFYSPLMHAFPVVEVDSALTFFLNDFVKHGAKIAGLISVQQTINDTVAQDIQRRYTEYHGGSGNWSKPLVLGLGAAYTPMQMTLEDMAYAALDAHNEARICNAFSIDPIVAGAKAGLDVSTYSNKEAAFTDWYRSWVVPSWEEDAEIFESQLLPFYEGEEQERFTVAFDTRNVWALTEDMNAKWTRVIEATKIGLICRDEGREAIDYSPIDNVEEGMDERKEVWLNAAADPKQIAVREELQQRNLDNPPKEKPQEAEQSEADKEAAESEEKKFRKFARSRVKEGKADVISEWEFKFVSLARQAELLSEFGIVSAIAESDTPAETVTLYSQLKRIAQQYRENTTPAPQPVNVTVHIPQQAAPVVNMSAAQAPDVTVNVSPTPIEVKNAANVAPTPIENKVIMPEQPKPMKRKAKIIKDKDGHPVGIEDV